MKTARTKTTTKHPYAAIEHRVIDSPAYAELTHSSCRLLTLLTRQLTKENNGNLQATFTWCKERGIGSEHTLRDAIADLIAHGFIYRTRSHGANKAWARYAVTWLPIKNKDGLFLAGFVPCAWRDWEPPEKKAPSKKCRNNPAESAVSQSRNRQKVQEHGGQKMQTMNCVTNTSCLSAPLVPPDNAPLHDDFIREREIEQAGYWDGERGEYIKLPVKTKTRSAKIEQVRVAIQAMQR